jgi:AraC-like DNA-binding protein
LNSVRRELVQRYMENQQYSLQVVGRQLGFSTPSSFTRWFSAEFGMAPRAWRNTPR